MRPSSIDLLVEKSEVTGGFFVQYALLHSPSLPVPAGPTTVPTLLAGLLRAGISYHRSIDIPLASHRSSASYLLPSFMKEYNSSTAQCHNFVS
jgi:hypothetical protein